MKNFPQPLNEGDIYRAFLDVVRIRREDVIDYNNLDKKFILGRKVSRVPSSSTDVLDTDREGDVSMTSSYLYVLIDNAGTLAWRRVALSSW